MPEYLSPGVYVEEVPSSVQPIVGVSTSTAGFIGIIPDSVNIPERNPDFDPTQPETPLKPKPAEAALGAEGGAAPAVPARRPDTAPAANSPYKLTPAAMATPALEVRLCTSFSDFRRYFGHPDAGAFSTDAGQNTLAHAVFGFFGNGGSRCYVVRITDAAQMDSALGKFAAIDEIAIVAAPGITDDSARSSLLDHCDSMKDRFAILDGPREVKPTDAPKILPKTSKNAAFYHPWIKVFDLAEKVQHPKDKGVIFVPPSGHIAGVYARVDTERGVHKAPANEEIRGALGLQYAISKADQAGLNPQGINCIREMNGNIKIWGARTIGGDRNFEWKYVNVRRVFLYLRKSIDNGTQWVVFEPNDLKLWAKIKRNVTAFLTNVWRDGALFGATPAEAFYVKCDAETNPPEVRELGQVVTEIGVAIVRPAEFVIFRIAQWQPETKS
jgi:Bacteriophage tail sheath protein